MAISWITALKLVPWGDVIEATPQVVKAAKSLLRKKDAEQAVGAQPAAAGEPLKGLKPQFFVLEPGAFRR